MKKRHDAGQTCEHGFRVCSQCDGKAAVWQATWRSGGSLERKEEER
jgi:hypothetical protein